MNVRCFGFMGALFLLLVVLPTSAQQVPAHLQEAAKELSKSYTINYDETRKIVLNLPDGYLVRRMPNVEDDLVLCPWNEFFIIAASRIPASSGLPVLDETSINAELDELEKAHKAEGAEVKERKVWVTPKGPMASLELWSKVEKKTSASSVLVFPVGSELWLFSLVGQDSALADQKVIQSLIVEELGK